MQRTKTHTYIHDPHSTSNFYALQHIHTSAYVPRYIFDDTKKKEKIGHKQPLNP